MTKHKLRNVLIILSLLCLVALFVRWSLQRPAAPGRPNILLITLDTTRRDYLSCYGYSKKTTPAIDKLAGEGVMYEQALSPSSWTLAAHASIFTGMLPTHHRADFGADKDSKINDVLEVSCYTLHPLFPTLAGELKKAGYDTAGVIAAPILKTDFGVAHGFNYYDDRLLKSKNFERDASEVSNLAIDWLTKHVYSSDVPFFLFLNYFDPHTPYRPPPPWGDPTIPIDLCHVHSGHYDDVFRGVREVTDEERRILLTQYEGEIRFMDSQIGRLFDNMKQLGLYDSTFIIVTADHGESLGEHRLLDHGRALYEELIHVPLILKYPLRDRRRGRIAYRVSTLSIMPTILQYLRKPIPTTVDGPSLNDRKQLLIAESPRDLTWTTIYGERFNRDQRAIYNKNYKWIWSSNGNHELYNLVDDPGEKHNLHGKFPTVEREFETQLAPLLEESKKLSSLTPPEIDNELKSRLRALGYIR